MRSSHRDHFATMTSQVEALRISIQALEHESGVGGRTLKGQQTVDDQQAVYLAFDELDEAVTHVSDVLLALAEALNEVPRL